jgi:hypothetical protein
MANSKLMMSYCDCDICTGKKQIFKNESDMFVFVGANIANKQCDLTEFEQELTYSSVTHWDVGYCEDPRYFIYNDACGNSIAWYDRAKFCGYV